MILVILLHLGYLDALFMSIKSKMTFMIINFSLRVGRTLQVTCYNYAKKLGLKDQKAQV